MTLDGASARDLLRLLRLSVMQQIACETIEQDDNMPSYLVRMTIDARRTTTRLLATLRGMAPANAIAIDAIANGDDIQDRLLLFDELSTVDEIPAVIKAVKNLKKHLDESQL